MPVSIQIPHNSLQFHHSLYARIQDIISNNIINMCVYEIQFDIIFSMITFRNTGLMYNIMIVKINILLRMREFVRIEEFWNNLCI